MQKRTIIPLTLILITSTLLGSSVLTRGHSWGDDFAAYIMQAKSIITGNMDEFVAANTFTVTQSDQRMGLSHTPGDFHLCWLRSIYCMASIH